MEAGSVCGNFFEAWGSPTKKQTVNDSSTNNMTLLNSNIHTYKLYTKCDNKTILYTDKTWVNAHHVNGWKVPSGKVKD